MIGDAVYKAKAGAELSDKTAKILDKIVLESSKVTSVVNEIAQSSKEQAVGLSQISQALQQIETVTQTNTASAEESAAASEQLSSQAVNLKSMMKKFKLKEFEVNSYNYRNTSSRSERMMINQKNAAAVLEDKNRNNDSEIVSLDDTDFGKYSEENF